MPDDIAPRPYTSLDVGAPTHVLPTLLAEAPVSAVEDAEQNVMLSVDELIARAKEYRQAAVHPGDDASFSPLKYQLQLLNQSLRWERIERLVRRGIIPALREHPSAQYLDTLADQLERMFSELPAADPT